MADPRPAIDDRPVGISERSIGPLAINSANQSRPTDPVPIQSGRNSGPLILGIARLHRPDWSRTELDRANFVPALTAPNQHPCPKGTTLPS